MKANLNKSFSLGSACSGTDEQMVQLDQHAKECNSSVGFEVNHRQFDARWEPFALLLPFARHS